MERSLGLLTAEVSFATLLITNDATSSLTVDNVKVDRGAAFACIRLR